MESQNKISDSPARILIVEDEVMLAKELSTGLKKSGYDVAGRVATGEEAVVLAQETDPDLILMDIKLAGVMDGIEASAVIRSRSDAAIIYLTAHATSDVFEKAKITEPYAYLTKPVSPNELERAVAMALYKRRMDKSLKESEQRYRSLYSAMSEGVALHELVYDQEGTPSDYRILDVNPAYETITGISRKKAMGSRASVLYGTGFAPFLDVYARVTHTRRPVSFELPWEPMKKHFSVSAFSPAEGKFATVFEDITERKRYSSMLMAQNLAHKNFLDEVDPNELFDSLLQSVLRITDSEHGYIGEVFDVPGGGRHQLSRAISNIAWTPDLKKFYEEHWRDGLRFEADETLYGQVIATGKPLISNDPKNDRRSKGLPEGHPPIVAFMGLPLYKGTTLVGTLGVANRPGGYDEELVEFLEPYLSTCSSIISAFKNDQRRKDAEKSLRESEELHSATLANISDAIFITDDRGAFTYVCPNTFGIFGRSPEEIEAMGTIDRLLGLDLYDLEELQMCREIRNLRHTISRKSGEERTLLVTVKRVAIRTGTVLYTCRDITELARVEQDLRESEEKFTKAFLNAPVMMTLSSVEEGTYLEVNDEFCRISGFSREEAVGRTSIGLGWISPHDRKRLFDELVDRGHVSGMEMDLTSKDNRVVHAVYHAQILQTQKGPMLLSIAHDITDRKRMEQELETSLDNLQEQRDTLARIFESAPYVMMIVETDGRIAEINRAGSAFSGHPKEDLLGRLGGEVVRCLHSFDGMGCGKNLTCASCPVRMSVMHTMKTGEPIFDEEAEFTVKRDSGTETLSLLISTSRIRVEGADKVLLTIADITEKRKAEATEAALRSQLLHAQKMESIGTLAGGVAHDFNNHLQVILGYAEMALESKGQDDPDRDLLAPIKDAALDGADLVKSLLTFSRRVETNMRPMNINRLLEKISKMLGRLIPKMIRITFSLDPNVKPIHADAVQIEQAVLNLAVNANHAMGEKGLLLVKTSNVVINDDDVRESPDVQPGDYVLLTVSDTGEGMTRDVVERMFEPFFSTKKVGEGTGLGLSIVYGIVKGHGAHISCESTPGGGTTFKILFPAIATASEPQHRAPVDAPGGGSETILLVDDEQRFRDLAAMILAHSGYRVLTASSGKEALEVYRRQKDGIDVILLDLIMPEMGGRDCLSALIRFDPEVKVIISSGIIHTRGDLTDTYGSAKGFIPKPFTAGELLSTVRKVIDGISPV